MKAIITVIGSDRPGIIALVSAALYRCNVNILDINQTIMGGYFTMVMMVDLKEANRPFEACAAELDKAAEELGMEIRMQRNEIFDAMHRL
ncbi:MAG: ACT domain-containing protein [Clostridia bacterium]|nr:ACT domain-containing protein [Clostridia bacterium]